MPDPITARILIVGGAPRVPVDAVRHLTVHASGATAASLAGLLRGSGIDVDLLLSRDAVDAAGAQRFADRADLEAGLRTWLMDHPLGVVVMSAAVNDYVVSRVEWRRDGATRIAAAGAKIPSGADEVLIRLAPAGKVIDRLRDWGHRGALVAFKYEDASSVIASAETLARRTGAALVVANSLCGAVQALVVAAPGTSAVCERFADRARLIDTLAGRIRLLAERG